MHVVLQVNNAAVSGIELEPDAMDLLKQVTDLIYLIAILTEKLLMFYYYVP